MPSTIVMTVIGPDRPGLVQLVAARVADNGGNWLESRMCHLGGQFAGILRVEVGEGREAKLIEALRTLESDGLQLVVSSGAGAAANLGELLQIEFVGQDRPGILRSISGVLASHQVNVEELTSERVSAPMGGGTLFQAKVSASVPPKVDLTRLRGDLEKIAADLMIDLEVKPKVAKR